MRRSILSIVIAFALLLPGVAHSQSGDATWLDNMHGLETAIGRSWMAPIVFSEALTTVEVNPEGTVVSKISSRSEPSATPDITDEMQTQLLSALIFEYDSARSAEDGIELFHAVQQEQLSRDPRSPATNEFDADHLGDTVYASEGTYEIEDFDGDVGEWAVVYLLVQQDNLVYQVFGQFVPGNHTEIATDVAEAMINADAGDAEPMYDMEGDSAGGLWDKLNAIEIAMPEDSSVNDIEVYPPADDAVMGESVVVPQIDIDALADVPGLVGSWHITYAPAESGPLVATPNVIPDGVFNIELWVMEFEDSTHATASAISLSNTLIDPLGIFSHESGAFGTEEEQGITMVSTGFVRDRSIPEGDAAVVVMAEGSTLYASRVYSNGPAPTPIARELVEEMASTEVGDAAEAIDRTVASGGVWDRFPQSGDELLFDLEPAIIRQDDPSARPGATPTN